jgi:hypothetical protein
MTEAMDMDGRLDQLVRAGLMPTSSLPLLKRAISRMHAGMSLQGAERDVMNMFISSMMFIVLGDDTVFNKARAGAKGYATEETELDENAPIVAHLTKRYGDNIRKSHVMSAAKDFGVDPSKLSKAVRKKLGKSMLDEAKEKTEYDYEGDMAMSQLKSIIANSQRMHDSMSEDTNLPEWVQSKITLAEDYITTASNYMQGEMTEEMDMPFEGPYRKVGERKDKYGNTVKNVPKFLAKKAMNKQKNEEIEQVDELSVDKLDQYRSKARKDIIDADDNDDNRMYNKRAKGYMAASKQVQTKLAKEDVEQVDELSKATMGSYVKKASGAEQPKNVMSPKNVPLTKIAAYQGDSETGHFGKRFNQATYDKAERLRKNRETGIKTAVNKLTKEDAEQVDEISKAMAGRYINKAKDSIDMTSYRSGIKDGTAISSSTPYKSNNPLEKKLTKRHKGISMAVNKLTKEDIDAVKKMNESYKTAFETALNEYGIKSPSELDESKRKEFFNHVDLEFKKGDN